MSRVFRSTALTRRRPQLILVLCWLCKTYFQFNQHLTHAFLGVGWNKWYYNIYENGGVDEFDLVLFFTSTVSRDPHLLRSKDTWAVFGCALSLVAVQNLWIILEINILPSPLDSFIFLLQAWFNPPPLLVFNKLCFKLPSELICPEITVASKRGSENDILQVNKTVQILLAQDLQFSPAGVLL